MRQISRSQLAALWFCVAYFGIAFLVVGSRAAFGFLRASSAVNGATRMTDTKQKHPNLALDGLILVAGAAFLLLLGALGAQAGRPIEKGTPAVLGGLYAMHLGVLFLLSYFFPDATYVLGFLRYECEECTRGGKGRHMAFVYFALGLGLGAWLLLRGLGVV